MPAASSRICEYPTMFMLLPQVPPMRPSTGPEKKKSVIVVHRHGHCRNLVCIAVRRVAEGDIGDVDTCGCVRHRRVQGSGAQGKALLNVVPDVCANEGGLPVVRWKRRQACALARCVGDDLVSLEQKPEIDDAGDHHEEKREDEGKLDQRRAALPAP